MSDAVEDKDLLDLVSRIPKATTQESSGETITQAEKSEKRAQKVPGLELTFGDLEDLELTEEDAARLVQLKQKYDGNVHLVRTLKRPYVIRECKRIEWRNKFLDLQSELIKMRQKMVADGREEAVVDQVLDMVMQEKIVSWLLVDPLLEPHELRASLAPGEVETLFKCTMMAQGYAQNVVPIKV